MTNEEIKAGSKLLADEVNKCMEVVNLLRTEILNAKKEIVAAKKACYKKVGVFGVGMEFSIKYPNPLMGWIDIWVAGYDVKYNSIRDEYDLVYIIVEDFRLKNGDFKKKIRTKELPNNLVLDSDYKFPSRGIPCIPENIEDIVDPGVLKLPPGASLTFY